MAKLKRSFPKFEQPGRVTFGAGCLKVVAQFADLQQTAFFVSGQKCVQDRLQAVLQKAGHDSSELPILSKPTGEPTRKMIRVGAEFLAKTKPKRIVALGGGAVMDWSRLAWCDSIGILDDQIGLKNLERNPPERPEICLIPTTCGSGAEAASVAVYSQNLHKTPVNTPALIADHVVLDGQFLAILESNTQDGTLENYLSDALSHAIEAFVSLVPCSMAKEMALASLSMIFRNHTQSALQKNDPIERRERLMEAGYFGGLAAAHCSVGVVHALAHSLAAHGVRHGAANAVGLVSGIRINAETPAIKRLVNRSGFRTLDDFLEPIQWITRRAIRNSDQAAFMRLLSEGTERRDLLQRMKKDVCLRTNPRPLGEDELNQFLNMAWREITEA